MNFTTHLPLRALFLLALATLCVLAANAGQTKAGVAVPIAQGQLAFLQTPFSADPEIAVIDVSGDSRKELTNNGVEDERPSWSADGRKLAESRNLHDNVYGIITMNADGSNPHQVSNGTDDDASPIWTPDGHLLFASYRDFSFSSIYIEDADGGNPKRLSPTQQTGADYEPQMSPNGSEIVFISDRAGDNDLWIMDADGKNPTRLTFDGGAYDFSPTWAPDGSTIFYTMDTGSSENIWAIDPDGSNQRQITTTGGSYPAFSPTGEHVAFSAEDGIDIMTPDGQNVTHVPNSVGTERGPVWRPGLLAGDSDCDGNVGVLDVLAGLKAMADAATSGAGCLAAANVACTDALDANDLLPVLAHVAETQPDIPAGCKSLGELLG